MPHLHPMPRAARRVAGVLTGAIVAAGIATGVVACAREQIIGEGGVGLTQVLLTDAPFPYDSVAHVSLFVESIAASPSADTTPANTNWVVIATPHQAFDLLDLQNGKTATLGGAVIPAGRYHSVRMVLNTDRSSVVGRDGSAVPVQWGSSAGFPTLYALVESPIDLPAAGGSVVIDFDVGRSFLCPGTSCSGELLFSPVFRAVDSDATGSISGTVRRDTLLDGGPALGRATITVYAGDIEQLASFTNWPVAATGRTDDAGHFTVAFLPAGKYVVRADPPRDAPLSAIVSGGVTVAAGQTTVVPDLRLPTLGTGGGGGGGGDTTVTGGGGGGNGGATGTVATVDVGPASGSLAVGDSVVFVATARDAQGNDLSGEALAWTVSDSTVALPIAAGTRYIAVRGIAPGTATVAAIARSGARGTATVTVH